ncbi:hypothetical protein [Microcoleus sp. Pol10D4]|uniref:hypothetical protein n=1 Tax=Microcoleus sp. Pol10D4 TaxID=3055387 RepID=UPI002FD657BD
MGSMTQAIKSVTGQDQAQKDIKDRLELLLMVSKAKLQAFRSELNEQFLNPAQVNRIQIPGIRAIRFIEQYHVAATSKFSQQCGDHLEQAIDSFFSIGGENKDTKKAVQNGVKALISTAIDGFIGSTEAGESEQKIYVVVPENNAFVRADICLWKYHMTSVQLTEDNDTAVAYVLCKSVIDHNELKLDELIYLVSEALNSGSKSWIEKEEGADKKKYLSYDGINPAKRDPNGNDTGANWIEWTVDLNNPSGGSPPSIRVVEAYIEELIRVWNKLRVEKREAMLEA